MRLGRTLTETKVFITMNSHTILRFVYIYMQTSDRSHVITLRQYMETELNCPGLSSFRPHVITPKIYKSFSPHYRNADKIILNEKEPTLALTKTPTFFTCAVFRPAMSHRII